MVENKQRATDNGQTMVDLKDHGKDFKFHSQYGRKPLEHKDTRFSFTFLHLL